MSEVLKRAGTFRSFDGLPVYYETRGEGRPLVLAYGISCGINHWIHQLRGFSDEYQTIVLDYRGHHKTPAPANRENLTLDAIARDIGELCRFLGVQKASFWGHSYGAQVLVRLADMRPDLIGSLVLINGFASNPIREMFGFELMGPAFQLFKEGHRSFPETLSSTWKAAVSNPLSIPISALFGGFNLERTNLKDIEVYARGVASIDLDVFIELFDQMMKYDGRPTLDRIEAPTLIVSGEKDGVTPPTYQESMHERIKGSRLVKLPEGSHCTQLDLPFEVNGAIREFLVEIGYGPKKPGRHPWRPSK